MNDSASQSALREWRMHFTHPARLVSLLGAALILTVMGPFNTGEVMRAVPRLAYWTVLVTLSYAAGFAANLAADRIKGASTALRIAVAGPMTALAVFAVVYLLNGLSLGFWATGRDLGLLAGNVVVISVIIAAIFQIAHATTQPDEAQTGPPALVDRLPIGKRGALVSVSVEDHYVRIRTTRGEDMVLMRLADAIRGAQPTKGIRVHRSHWVALAHVTAATRKGDGAVLTLTHGPDIPVSRANVAAIKEAGLLPA